MVDVPDHLLARELARRAAERSMGRCDVCCRPWNAPACGWEDRHRAAAPAGTIFPDAMDDENDSMEAA